MNDLHSHYSSIVNYNTILDELQKMENISVVYNSHYDQLKIVPK